MFRHDDLSLGVLGTVVGNGRAGLITDGKKSQALSFKSSPILARLASSGQQRQSTINHSKAGPTRAVAKFDTLIRCVVTQSTGIRSAAIQSRRGAEHKITLGFERLVVIARDQ